MSIKKWKKILPSLEFLQKLSLAKRKTYILNASIETIRLFSDFVFNLNIGNFPIPEYLVDKIRPFKSQILSLCKKKKSIKARKEELIKKDFFGKILKNCHPFHA